MRKGKRLFCAVLALCLMLVLTPAAFADYGYTVRVFAGNQGTINGANSAVVTSFSVADVTVNADTADKYYVRGIRESGHGTGTIYTELPDIVRDQDYVVLYGLKDDAVTLTIRYQDDSGNTLLPDREYYGNVGDKPQVKAAYVEGYTPKHRYITGTLSGDTTWTFVYVRDTAPVPETDTGVYPGANPGVNPGPNPGANPAPNPDNGTGGEDVLDMDVPLAEPDSTAPVTTPAPSLPPVGHAPALSGAAVILIVMLLASLLAFIYWYLLFYRKKKRREEMSGKDVK